MFVATVHHYCKTGLVESAAERIDRNGLKMAELDGFMYRYRMTCTDDDHKITTITTWKDQAAYQGWLAARKTLAKEGPAPYDKVVTELYIVEQTLRKS